MFDRINHILDEYQATGNQLLLLRDLCGVELDFWCHCQRQSNSLVELHAFYQWSPVTLFSQTVTHKPTVN